MESVSECLARSLASRVSAVFGLMGNGNAYFIDALTAGPLGFTAVRHEAATVAAADAYFRASGKLAVATVTYGPGFTNTLTALAEAALAQIPLILVVGGPPTGGSRPWDIDQVASARALGVETFTATAEDAPTLAHAAVDFALGNHSPVVLMIPYDLANSPAVDGVEDSKRSTTIARRVEIDTNQAAAMQTDPAQIAAALALLTSAQRPLILAGRGAWISRAGPPLAVLAERLGALTATTVLARNIFDDSTYDLGIAGGFGYDRSLDLIGQADVILVVGSRLNQFTMRFGGLLDPESRLVQIDRNPSARHPSADIFIAANARDAAEDLVAALPTGPANPGWRVAVPEVARGEHRYRAQGLEVLDDCRLDPRSVAEYLESVIPADRVVVQDGGHFIGWAATYWSIPAPNRLIMVGTAFQTIGLGFPSAVGASQALPDSFLVVVSGDGGALMALADLESVVRTVRRGLVLIYNDAAYGAEIHQYGSKGLSTGPMLIDEVDFAGIALALGARASTIRTMGDFAELESWIDSGSVGVFLVDCRVSSTIVAPYMKEIVEMTAAK